MSGFSFLDFSLFNPGLSHTTNGSHEMLRVCDMIHWTEAKNGSFDPRFIFIILFVDLQFKDVSLEDSSQHMISQKFSIVFLEVNDVICGKSDKR